MPDVFSRIKTIPAGTYSKLKQVVESSDTRAGKYFDIFIQCLIILSLLTFSVETLPDLSDQLLKWLRYFEIVTVSIFTGEYLLRIAVADKKTNYIFSFYGIIDLIAILPFYVSSGIDLRSARIFRLFRLLRAFKLIKYSSAAKRLGKAVTDVKDELIIFLIFAVFVLYLAAVGIYYFEHEAQPEAFKSVIHCLWWAVVTLTTVGYGDAYPVTAGGKIFSSILIIIGLGIVAVPTGLLASSLAKTVDTDEIDEEGDQKQ